MMVQIFTFLLEASGILLVLSFVYFAFFRKFTFYKINRAVIISIVIMAIMIALFDIEVTTKNDSNLLNFIPLEISAVVAENFTEEFKPIEELTGQETTNISPAQKAKDQKSTFIQWSVLLGFIYLSGVIFMLVKLVLSIYKIRKINRISFFCERSGHFVMNDIGHSFSFFNWIFISPEVMEKDDYQIILKHEIIHCNHFHSVDVILFELMKSVFWFNPVVYFLAKESRLINEFYTDMEVMTETGLEVYSNALFKYQLNPLKQQSALLVANTFALLSLKPRVMQLIKKPSDNRSKLSYLAFLPILSLLFIAFSCNINEELENQNRIKSIKAYFYDEYGDQADRNGKLTVDISLNPDGSFANEDEFRKRNYNSIKSSLNFIQWGKEVEILKYKERWPQVKRDAIEVEIEALKNHIQERPLYTFYDGKWDTLKEVSKVSRELNSRGFQLVAVHRMEGERVRSTFTIDLGELYGYGDFGRIKTLRANRIIDADYAKPLRNTAIFSASGFREDVSKERQYNFTYDDHGNLTSSVVNGSLQKSFKYDDLNRLLKIHRIKNDKIISSYLISYNTENEISEVKAFNMDDEIEFTMKYEYEYY